jgi:molybdopterin-guanine dinucleotide biosynthesis protein A
MTTQPATSAWPEGWDQFVPVLVNYSFQNGQEANFPFRMKRDLRLRTAVTETCEDNPMSTAGIILCGGQSARMGRPKAWLPFAGEFMLGRIVRLLGNVPLSPLIVVAASEQDVPPLPPGIEIVRDAHEGRGPLQGLAAGLAALSGRAEAAYVTSCDVPFLRPAFVRRLIELRGEYAICVPDVGGYRHPLAAVYRLDVASVVAQLLAEDRLRSTLLLEHAPTRFVSSEELAEVDPELMSLRNLNTPEEYEDARREAEGT